MSNIEQAIRRLDTWARECLADDEAEQDIHALIAEVRRLREQEQTIRLEMARDALNESEDLAGRLNAVLADAGIVVDTTYDVALRTLLQQRDAALAECDEARLSNTVTEHHTIQQLTAALTEARRVLREVQWDRSGECPLCGGLRDGDTHVYHASHVEVVRGHFPACALAAVLAQEEAS